MRLLSDPLPADMFDDRHGEIEIPLCPHCLEVTEDGQHFCQACMAPLTFYASTAWYESIWAFAWIVARAFQTAWPRRLHAWGTLLIFGPDMLAVAFVALFGGAVYFDVPDALPELYESGGIGEALAFVVWALSFALHLAFIMRAFGRWAERGGIDPWAEEPSESETPSA
ncbi:MAG: zinc ribbon domain-containing protein [Planctomycetota bacterium]|nr:zinc ribbon domain-containing protein [Planctomycetota bacterium]